MREADKMMSQQDGAQLSSSSYTVRLVLLRMDGLLMLMPLKKNKI